MNLNLVPLLALIGVALANFKVSVDKTSYNLPGDQITVSWKDDGNSPNINSYPKANFYLCTFQTVGKLNCPIHLTSEPQDISDITKISLTVPTEDLALGGNGKYTLQLTGVNGALYSVQYSPWFSVTGMTGTQSAVSGDVNGEGQSVPSGTWSSYTVPQSVQNLPSPWMTPYQWQQGPTRFAPFQSTPGTTITYKLTATRRYPTSAFTAFTTILKTQLPSTTQTPSPSITVTQQAHTDNSVSVDTRHQQPARVTPALAARRKRWAD